MAVVGIGIAYHLSFSVTGTIGRAHYKLCLSVAIKIIKNKRCIVGTAADVNTKVNAP